LLFKFIILFLHSSFPFDSCCQRCLQTFKFFFFIFSGPFHVLYRLLGSFQLWKSVW
jgi:hypothetical protein